MGNKISYNPHPFLAKYIDRYYTFDQSNDSLFELPPILTGTGLELIFYSGTPLSIKGNKLSNGHIVCPRNIDPILFNPTTQASFLSVRFKSGAFRHFTSIPFLELNNTFLSVEEIWGSQGRTLLTELDFTKNTHYNVKILDSFLLNILTQYQSVKNQKWDHIIDQIYYQFNSKNISELAQESQLSLRQFERVFKSQFGLTPKSFQRIARFQHSIKTVLLDKQTQYLNTALDNGYYDQSHFINEFKYFTLQKPRDFLNNKNFNNHFYNKSLKSNLHLE